MFYEEQIDEKKTIQNVKRHLQFLGRHMNSISYQEYLSQSRPMLVKEEDIMDYMKTAGGLLQVGESSCSRENPVLHALARKDAAMQRQKEREQQIRWLCYGLSRLKEKERQYLVERYLYHMDNEAIMERHGIVESTLNRNIRKGCLHLAVILKIEVLVKKENEVLPA